jgi:hypothetical protein
MAGGHQLTTRRRLPSVRRRELASDIASGLPGNGESDAKCKRALKKQHGSIRRARRGEAVQSHSDDM